MKLIVVYYLLVSVFFLGCTTTHNRINSEWKLLENAKPVSCELLPKDKRWLDVESVQAIHGPSAALVTTNRLRNGSPAYFYTPLPGAVTLDGEDFQRRAFGTAAIFAGGGRIAAYRQTVGVIVAREARRSRIEIRTLDDNVVRLRSDYFAKDIVYAKALIGSQGLWLVYKENSADLALDDTSVNVTYFEFSKANASLKRKKFKTSKLPPDTQLVSMKRFSEALAVWRGERSLMARSFNARSITTSQPTKLDIKVASEIESWRVAFDRNGLLIAMVDGDSLVGRASLKIARIRWDERYSRRLWIKTLSMKNQHASEPMWVVAKQQTYLLLPKWLDEETTVATYKIGSDAVEASQPFGIFPQGSRLADAFFDHREDEIFAILRLKKARGWRFELCNFGEF